MTYKGVIYLPVYLFFKTYMYFIIKGIESGKFDRFLYEIRGKNCENQISIYLSGVCDSKYH